MNDRIQQLAEKYTANCLNEATANVIRQIIITALQEYSAWKPIETAPKDWSSMILYASDERLDSEVIEGYFSCFDGGRGEWVSRCGTTVHPTHWMPLPEPPAP